MGGRVVVEMRIERPWGISGNWPGKAGVNNTTLRNGLKKWKGRDSSVSIKRLVMKTRYSNVNFKLMLGGGSEFDFKGNKVKMVDIMAIMMRKLMLGGGFSVSFLSLVCVAFVVVGCGVCGLFVLFLLGVSVGCTLLRADGLGLNNWLLALSV
ncbi:hypothetical protein Q3G72_033102 [Acer saccharum]|nr:hypothetical protein Q3G72_033102 [Acer saccharum]